MGTGIILWGLVFSSIGLGYVIYGRRQNKKLVFYCGVGLMIYPYFVADLTVLILVGLGLIILPKLLSRFFD